MRNGVNIQSRSKPLRFVPCSECTVPEYACGERNILFGREEGCYPEGRTTFECECGEKLALDEDYIGSLVGSFGTT
jgi:hypothetical protein